MLALHIIEPLALLAPRSTDTRWLADPHEQRAASLEAALYA
jgi:hypothetical protein